MAKAKRQTQSDDDNIDIDVPVPQDEGGDDVNYQMGTIVVDMGNSEEEAESDLDPVDISEYEEINEENASSKKEKTVSSDDDDTEGGSVSDRVDPFLDNYSFDSDETWPE
jgi:hypothetical protein